jgi:tRNA(Arg) A34 adenosine deaminase TadA
MADTAGRNYRAGPGCRISGPGGTLSSGKDGDENAMTERRPDDEALLRRSFAVARRAHKNGNHPFGALIADAQGHVLIEKENGYWPDRDMTGHAERLLATEASKRYRPEFLASCTLYSSAEPCAMCAGAIYWAGIGRVVFGMTERALKDATGNHAENPTLDLPCRTVFAAGQRPVEVIGPLLEAEAAALHDGVWDKAG